MRVPIVLFALATTPFLAVVAQGTAAVKDAGSCEVADANRSPTAWSHERPADPKGRLRTGCSPVSPAQQPPQPPPPTGTVSIAGTVFNDVNGWPGLAGWVVELTGSVTVTTVTDAAGTFAFTGLPGGVYTICEAVQSGWRQTWPTSGTSCPTGLGYTFTLADGQSGSLVDFANRIQ